MRVLVTAGGTSEPVDGVRRLTNISTGTTGGVLARRFAERGAKVVLLHAQRARVDVLGIERETFETFDELAAVLERRLSGSDFDAVIHLAAVSDYRVATIEVDGRPASSAGKIPSGRDVVIRLAPTPKLVDRLRAWSRNPAVRVVAFKLTDDEDPAKREDQVRELLARGVADLVVHNDRSEIGAASHRCQIWRPDGPVRRTETKSELADALFELLGGTPGVDPTVGPRS
jgi:phosphopantothenoylcysteine synthetase/decarboxylase